MPGLATLSLGQYYPVESPAHRLDVRVKIVVTLLWATVLLAISNFLGLLAMTLVLIVAIKTCRVPGRLVLRGLRPLLHILWLTLLIHLLFTGGPQAFAWGPLSVSYTGIELGLFVTVRLVLLVAGTSLLTLTTTPIQLTDGLEYLLRPLKLIRVSSHELALMMGIAVRFVPLLLGEADKIMKAQMARGADFSSGGVVKRARGLIPLLIPLFVAVFRHSGELASAMESRCYQRGQPRTRLRELQIRVPDWIFFAAGSLSLLLVLYVGRLPQAWFF